MTKTLRDVHEGGKLVNRIEDARAERLLMGIERERLTARRAKPSGPGDRRPVEPGRRSPGIDSPQPRNR